MMFASKFVPLATVLIAVLLHPVAGTGWKADCWPSWDCTGPWLANGDGMCKLPPYPGPDYPLGSGWPTAYYMGPVEYGVVKEHKCHTRKSTNSKEEAIQFCFDIGAKSACIWSYYGCDCMANPMTWGDPHFRTMAGENYDFHGICDLVLFSAPEMNTTIHVRTEELFEFSYISSAAIRINDDILEVGSWGEFIINGIDDSDLPPTIGGYPLEMKQVDSKNTLFSIDVGDGQAIRLKAYKNMVAVSLQVSENGPYKNGKGLMGSGVSGLKLGRDGTTVYEDNNDEFGFEWQVRDDEPKLFETSRAPQYPQKCIMPQRKASSKNSRRLGESLAREDAEKACARWGLNTEQCIYDVMVTNDLDAAQAGVF